MKMTFLMISISLLGSLAFASGGSDVGSSNGGNAEISCKGVDGAGDDFVLNMINIKGSGFGEANGVLQATTVAGVNTIDVGAWLVGREGKVEGQGINFKKNLYVEANSAFLNLDKAGHQQYQGEICSSKGNKTKVAGIQFTTNDCIQVSCVSSGISTLK